MKTRSRLVLKRACASRSSGEWKDEDYDVLARQQGRRSHPRRRIAASGRRSCDGDGRSRRSCRRRRAWRTAPPRRWTKRTRSFAMPGWRKAGG